MSPQPHSGGANADVDARNCSLIFLSPEFTKDTYLDVEES